MAAEQGPAGISWTDATWNPVRGCTRKSEGCRHCYAEKMAARFSGRDPRTGKPMWGHGFATVKGLEARWTGKVALIPDALDWPLRWRGHPRATAEGRPSRIFVNSTSDLFHENLAFLDEVRVAAIIALSPRHIFQSLTKRPDIMRVFSQLMASYAPADRAKAYAAALEGVTLPRGVYLSDLCLDWPLPNWWMGCSVDDQETANERIPELLKTPAAVRFISAEPLLGPLDLTELPSSWDGEDRPLMRLNALRGVHRCGAAVVDAPAALDWVIAGGESGRGSETRGDIRPAHPDWFRKLRDDCAAAGVPYFFKQWGGWRAAPEIVNAAGSSFHKFDDGTWMQRVDKGDAGNTLDGRQHLEFPKAPRLALAPSEHERGAA